jgi:replicative DNA helicase
MKPDPRQEQIALPSAIHSERIVLGAILTDDDSLFKSVLATGLVAEDFMCSSHRAVFSTMLDLYRDGCPIDQVSVGDRMGYQGDIYALMADLMAGAVVLKTRVLYHCQLVRNKARLRQMLKIAEWISETAPRAQDPERLVAEAVERLEAVGK